QTGYATLQCTGAVEAQFVYSLFSSNGIKLSEGTAFSSPPSASVKAIADEREGARLGLAIANDSDQTVTYTISVTNAPAAGSITLGPRSSIAKFISQFVPGIPPDNLGQVVVSSTTGTASIIGLRFTGPVFTTIPQNIAGSPGPTASSYHVFPQFADGKFGDGSYFRTTRIYSNPNSDAGASCTTQLRGLTTDGISIFTGNLSPGSAIVATTNGTQALQSGYATVECNSSIDAEALYSFYGPDGVKL